MLDKDFVKIEVVRRQETHAYHSLADLQYHIPKMESSF